MASAELEVTVVPRAAADHIGPFRDGVLRVRVTRPPAGGEANRAVQRLVARALDVAAGRLQLVSGGRGRRKRYAVDGLDAAEVRARLASLAD